MAKNILNEKSLLLAYTFIVGLTLQFLRAKKQKQLKIY